MIVPERVASESNFSVSDVTEVMTACWASPRDLSVASFSPFGEGFGRRDRQSRKEAQRRQSEPRWR